MARYIVKLKTPSPGTHDRARSPWSISRACGVSIWQTDSTLPTRSTTPQPRSGSSTSRVMGFPMRWSSTRLRLRKLSSTSRRRSSSGWTRRTASSEMGGIRPDQTGWMKRSRSITVRASQYGMIHCMTRKWKMSMPFLRRSVVGSGWMTTVGSRRRICPCSRIISSHIGEVAYPWQGVSLRFSLWPWDYQRITSTRWRPILMQPSRWTITRSFHHTRPKMSWRMWALGVTRICSASRCCGKIRTEDSSCWTETVSGSMQYRSRAHLSSILEIIWCESRMTGSSRLSTALRTSSRASDIRCPSSSVCIAGYQRENADIRHDPDPYPQSESRSLLTESFFTGFNFNETCGVLPSCIDDAHPAKYEPISCAEWVRLRFEKTTINAWEDFNWPSHYYPSVVGIFHGD